MFKFCYFSSLLKIINRCYKYYFWKVKMRVLNGLMITCVFITKLILFIIIKKGEVVIFGHGLLLIVQF